MTNPHEEKPWDFSNVINLVNSLTTYDKPSTDGQISTPSGNNNAASLRPPLNKPSVTRRKSSGLGDFSSIFEYLGRPSGTIGHTDVVLESTSPTLAQKVPEKFEYTSDGGIYPGLNSNHTPRTIRWDDQVKISTSGDDDDDSPTKTQEEDENNNHIPKLSKKQRQKRNRRERLRMANAALAQRSVSDLESEAEVQNKRMTPARKASIHPGSDNRAVPVGNRKEKKDGPELPVTKNTTPTKPITTSESHGANGNQDTVAVPASEKTTLPSESESPSPPKSVRPLVTQARQRSEPPPSATGVSQATTTPEKKDKQWPVSNPFQARNAMLTPSTVKPSRPAQYYTPQHSKYNNPIQQTTPPSQTMTLGPTPSVQDAVAAVQAVQRAQKSSTMETPSRANKHAIQPKIIRSGDDRHWALLLKLINDFYEDRSSLVRPANLTTHSNNPQGIHIFVDASNIFIGFHEQLKRARGIPQHARVPRVDMSFDALALLMERRRAVAKRVLVGSTPHIPAFDIARDVGYECSILDKVYKARELTERQKHFQDLETKNRKWTTSTNGSSPQHQQNNKRLSNGHNGDSGGEGSETMGHNTSATHAPEKFVEQGVDEILHLKILESVVDSDEPTTIVLATGDAAQAEYSSGFMMMVERALKKKWRVELVSWSKNISMMYKKASFRKQWGDNFRIIELDDYAEELLDM